MAMLTLNIEQINQDRTIIGTAIALLPTPSLLQLAGMLNLYGYCAAKLYGAVHKIDGKLVIDKAEFENLIAISQAGELEMTATVQYIQAYLTKYWKGACNSCPSIRRMRELMRDKLGLFDFTPQVKSTTTLPPVMKAIDYPRILLAYEVVECELYSRGWLPVGFEPSTKDEIANYRIPKYHSRKSRSEILDRELKNRVDDHQQVLYREEEEYKFPSHFGMNMVLLFNHCFEGILSFRRRLDAVAPKPNCLETVWNRRMVKRPAYSVWKSWREIPRNKKWNDVGQKWERAFPSVEDFNGYIGWRRRRGMAIEMEEVA